MGRFYLIIVGFLGLFGWLASSLPGGPDRSAKGTEHSGATTIEIADRNSVNPLIDGEAGALVLDRDEDGHFYAEVEVNGTLTRMLIDTGASGVALSAADARRAGIATTIGMSEHIGEGAGGAVYGDVVTIDSIRLGPKSADEVSGVVLRGGEMSLLGQAFLREFASVEISGDRMILR